MNDLSDDERGGAVVAAVVVLGLCCGLTAFGLGLLVGWLAL